MRGFGQKIIEPLRDIANRDFWRTLLPLALPITLQQMLISSLNLVDTLMVGRLGAEVIASVGVAGQLSFFINIVLFGVSSGGAVFIAQYWGAGDNAGIRRSFGIMLCLNLPLAIIMCVLCSVFPGFVISIFTNEAEMIAEASKYLRIAAFAYIGVSLSQTMSTILRCTEKVKLPMYASMVSSSLNVILNYVLIFGKLGFPEMGIRGAATATVISSFINPVILLSVSIRKKTIMIAPFREIFGFTKGFFKKFVSRAAPVVANEGLWSLGVLGYNMVFGRMGTENYAALTINRTVEDIAFIFFIGLCHAANITVGKRIGAGDIPEAKVAARRFMLLEPLISIFIGITIIAARPAILSLFNITDDVRSTAMVLLLIYGLEVGLRNIPYISIVGIFRAGGDTRSGMFYDMICLYAISLPIVIITGLIIKLPFVWVFLLMLLFEDIPKNIMCLKRFKSMKWIQPVTDINK